MNLSAYLVTVEVKLQVQVEVSARNYDEASEVALDLYTLEGSKILADEVVAIEDVTNYRDYAGFGGIR